MVAKGPNELNRPLRRFWSILVARDRDSQKTPILVKSAILETWLTSRWENATLAGPGEIEQGSR